MGNPEDMRIPIHLVLLMRSMCANHKMTARAEFGEI